MIEKQSNPLATYPTLGPYTNSTVLPVLYQLKKKINQHLQSYKCFTILCFEHYLTLVSLTTPKRNTQNVASSTLLNPINFSKYSILPINTIPLAFRSIYDLHLLFSPHLYSKYKIQMYSDNNPLVNKRKEPMKICASSVFVANNFSMTK